MIRLSVNRSTRILQFYDAAGERFYNTDRTEELRYLNKAQTFILVIDPLSVESFWQQLTDTFSQNSNRCGRQPLPPIWLISRPTSRSRRWA